jgi:hypothetical protein
MMYPMRVRALSIAAAVALAGCVSHAEVTIPSETAVITCHADGRTEVRSSAVWARPDGVHVLVINRADRVTRVDGLGIGVKPGRTELVVEVAPGSVSVSCRPHPLDASSVDPSTVPLEIVDPKGLYADPELECPDGSIVTSEIRDYFAPRLKLAVRVPLDEARRSIRGLLPGDELMLGGYPEQVGVPVLVVRDGAVLAAVDFGRIGRRWVSTGYDSCAEVTLDVR